MEIIILITTFNRPESLLLLLHDIKKMQLTYRFKIIIYNDGSISNYDEVISYLKQHFVFDYFKTDVNGGKENYWKLINICYNDLQTKNFDYFFQLPDDVRLIDNFFYKSIAAYNQINDNNKICLNLWNDVGRYKKSSWTNIPTKEIKLDDGSIIHKMGWIDMCFMSTKSFFELIDYKIERIERRYQLNKELSSGVGAQLSLKIQKANKSIYQVQKSFVIHLDHQSVMHPLHRVKTPLITNHDTVTVGIASMPSRIASLRLTINSIINQVDVIIVYLNNYNSVPDYLINPKIRIVNSCDALGDLGDAGKFYKSSEAKGYYFTIDDDLIYPDDYVKTAIYAIERYKRKSIITFHGRKFENSPVKSYYRGHSKALSCLRTVNYDEEITVPGTGVMAYHTDTIQFLISDFKASNMADIWAAKKAKKLNVNIMLIRHSAAWIKETKAINFNESIYANVSFDDSYQTNVLNSFI